MPRVVQSPEQFTIIGENIHATRIVLRNGRRAVTLDNGTEAVPFKGESGDQGYLTVPDWFKKTQPYEQGQIKHFLIAMRKGVDDDPDEREQGAAYIRYEVGRQVRAGASYLDVNVDEVDYDVDVQKRCMRWTVETAQEVSSVPPCVDSSLSEIIAEGLYASGILGETHASTFRYGEGWWRYTIPGEGEVDWNQIVRRLEEVGYDGVLSIELEDHHFFATTELQQEGILRSREYIEQFLKGS